MKIDPILLFRSRYRRRQCFPEPVCESCVSSLSYSTPDAPVMQCCTDHKVSPLSYTSFSSPSLSPRQSIHLPRSALSPQSLQLPQHDHIRIQKPIHTLPHARLLVLVQFAGFDGTRGDAFAEARVGEGVYRCEKGRVSRLLISKVEVGLGEREGVVGGVRI
jgi:hypothetical protein